jgi:hypothetical protein
MFDNRKLFFTKEASVHGTKNEDIVFDKAYTIKQCVLINKDFAHNVYIHPNGLYEDGDKVTLSKKIHWEYIYTTFQWDIESHLAQITSLWLQKPTAFADMWSYTVAFWKLNKDVQTDLSEFVSYINSAIQWQAVKIKQSTPILCPWFYNRNESVQTRILYHTGDWYSTDAPTELDLLKVNKLQEMYLRYQELMSLHKKSKNIFKNVFDVTVSSLNIEKVKSTLEWLSDVIIKDNVAYSPIGSKHKVYGDVKEMLACYFTNSQIEIDMYLKQEYGITVFNKSWASSRLSYGGVDLLFSEGWISISKESKKWEVSFRKVLMWDSKILWFAVTNKHYKWYTLDHYQRVYIMHHQWEQKLIYPETRVATFNSVHASQWLAFLWNDTELLTMFQVLGSQELTEYKIIDASGNNEFFYWVGDYVHVKDSTFPIVKALWLPTYINTQLSETTVRDFYDKMSKLWNDKKVCITILWSLALAGMNFWKLNWYAIMPFVFINGSTWSGKSEMRMISQSFLWYYINERALMVNNTTRQVLCTEATDPAILFLDEYTGIVDKQIENIIRNIANGWKAGRWFVTGNVFYDFASPMFIAWEDIPVSESVLNRAMFMDLDFSDRKENEMAVNMLDQLKTFTCFKEIVDFYAIADPKDMSKTFNQKKTLLITKGFTSREADVRSYVLVMNHYFSLIAEDEIIVAINENLHYVRQTLSAKSSFEQLEELLMQWVIGWKIRWSVMRDEVNEEKVIQMFVQKDYFRANQTKIKKYVDMCIWDWYDVALWLNKVEIAFSEKSVWFDWGDEPSKQAMLVSKFIEAMKGHLKINEINE